MASCDDDDDDFSLLCDDNHHPHPLHQPYTPITITTTTSPPPPFEDDAGSEKRKDRNEIGGDGTMSYGFNKRSKAVAVSSGGSGGTAKYRKDREEWSDTAIVCLLEAYTEKFTQLNRGNLRGRDWEEVAAVVSERCENQSKSVEQCKNKVDPFSSVSAAHDIGENVRHQIHKFHPSVAEMFIHIGLLHDFKFCKPEIVNNRS